MADQEPRQGSPTSTISSSRGSDKANNTVSLKRRWITVAALLGLLSGWASNLVVVTDAKSRFNLSISAPYVLVTNATENSMEDSNREMSVDKNNSLMGRGQNSSTAWETLDILERATLEAATHGKQLIVNSAASLQDPQLGFVHIGKAGGESIKSILQVGCWSYRNKRRRSKCFDELPPSRLSNITVQYTHCFQITNIPGHDNTKRPLTGYLFNVRHPVDRMISFYNYIHPGFCNKTIYRNSVNCQAQHQVEVDPNGFAAQFFGCFPALEDWVSIFRTNSSDMQTKTTKECVALGQKAILGQEDEALVAHTKANYRANMDRTILSSLDSTEQTHANQRLQQKQVMVVRTNSMWDDLKGVDRYFGGTGDFGAVEGTRVTHGSEHRNTSKAILTPDSYRVMCCALRGEMIAAVHLIQQAVNLDPIEKASTLDNMIRSCGAISWQDFLQNACPLPARPSYTFA